MSDLQVAVDKTNGLNRTADKIEVIEHDLALLANYVATLAEHAERPAMATQARKIEAFYDRSTGNE